MNKRVLHGFYRRIGLGILIASLLPAVPVQAEQTGMEYSDAEAAETEESAGAESGQGETEPADEEGSSGQGTTESTENGVSEAEPSETEETDTGAADVETSDQAEGECEDEEEVSSSDRTEEEQDLSYEGYLDQLFGTDAEGGISSYTFGDGTHSRRNSLSKNNQAVYDEIAAALPELADGERTDAKIQVPIANLIDGYTSGKMYTWEELGVSLGGSGQIDSSVTSAAMEALRAKLDYDAGTVRDAILTDYPYETYWMDGTVGVGSLRYRYTSDGMGFAEDSITISLEVEYKFRADDKYTVDVTKTGAGRKAAENAQSIVEKAQDLSDYGKLKSYLNAVCDLVDYNDAAAASSGQLSDTDDRGAWNLLYVFDGDPETKVVCEGYAEAYQYLCDRTDFSSQEIEVTSVTGQMNGGGHKWNLAHMEDGKNYLIDVTNCDEGSVGYPDRLFLVGSKTYTDSSSAFQADGVEYQYDSRTRELFSEEELALSETDYEAKESDTVRLRANRLSLSGNIGVQYDIEMPEEEYQNSDTWVVFDVDGREQRIAAKDGTAVTLTYPSTGETVKAYEYTCEVTASQMTSEIHASVVQQDGIRTELRTYSVKHYVDHRLSQSGISGKERELLQALENYGAYAQLYFGRNTENLANADLQDTDVSKVTAEMLTGYEKTVSGSVTGIVYYGSSLVLRSQTVIRHYFRLESGHAIGGYTFRNETAGTVLNPVSVGSQNLYYVDIPDLKANALNTVYTVSVQNGNGESEQLVYSAMSYAYGVLKESYDTEALQNLMRALALYSDKAERYFDGSSTISAVKAQENKLSGVVGDFYDMKLASSGTVARWESTLPQYASVSAEGRVSFLKEGASWIKAYDADGNVLQTCLACVVGEDIPSDVDFFVIPQLYGDAGGGQDGESEAGNSYAALSDAIAAMQNNGISTLFLPKGNYRIEAYQSIRLFGGMTLVMQDGTKIHGIGSAEQNYNLIYVRNVSNVRIFGGWIEGDLQRRQTSSTAGEGGMGIGVYGSSNVRIQNVRVTHCWGDGIYIGETSEKIPCSDITVTGCTSSENLRNNMSIVSAGNVTVEQSTFTDTPSNGKEPMMGIDIEPNDAGNCRNIAITNCTFRNNRQAGIGIIKQNSGAVVDQVAISGCDLADAFWNYSGTNVTLNGCRVSGEADLRRVVSVDSGTVFNEGTETDDLLVAELNPAAAGAGSSYQSDGTMAVSVVDDPDAEYGKALRIQRTGNGSKKSGCAYSLGQLKTADGSSLLQAGSKYRFVYSVKGTGEWGVQTSQTGWYGCLPESSAYKIGAVTYEAGSSSSCSLWITGQDLTSGMWLELEWLRIYKVQ